ncbi:MAG TPA: hypothetical protein VMX13_18315 [Sedimentisphaerales bacterium]|nr:hypothetical protein [Sedimentisphaerales bacterium]
MLSEAKHLAGEWEKSPSGGLRFFAALRDDNDSLVYTANSDRL